jgi:putative ABC transport system permease protein
MATRSLARRPATALATVLTFALALGANTSVFSLVWGVLLQPLPYSETGRLVRIHPDELFYTQLARAQRFAEEARSFDHVVPWSRTLFLFTGGLEPEEARGALVQWDHFEMLGVRPELGRGFRREDADAWPYQVVVLSHDLWVRRFGADASMVGRSVELSSRTVTVIGVMGRGHVPMEPDWEAWAPLPLDAALVAGNGMAMNARLRSGVTLEQATQDTRRTFATVWQENGYTATPGELATIRVVPLEDHLLGDVRRPLWVLMAAVAGILLLACANVANLLLAQADTRIADIAVRLSLGATRSRVALMMLTETGVMALLGCAGGLASTWVLLGWVGPHLPADFPRAEGVRMSAAVVLFGAAAMGVAAVVATVIPVLSITSRGLRSALGAGGRGSAARLGRVAPTLVGAEVALAAVLVVGAGLMLRSLGALRAVDPGFDARDVVAVRVAPPPGRYDAEGSVEELYRTLERAVAAVPGVTSTGSIMFLPMTSGGAWGRYRTTPEPPPDDAEVPSSSFRIVTPGYFAALRIALVRGRVLTDADDAASPPVAVVNETLARVLFGAEDPVGRFLYEGGDPSNPLRIVGVIADVHQTGLREEVFPELYVPLSQNSFRRMYVLARSTGGPGGTLAAVQAAIRGVDDGNVLSRSSRLQDVVAASVQDTRLLAQLLTLFGIVAMALGAVGVYGVTANAVSRRRREIGIRLALGAGRSSVTSRVVWRGMVPVALGLGAGLAGSLAVGRLIAGLLFQVAATDAVTLAVVPALLAGVALSALAVPALRAGRVDPVRTLREE